MDVKENIKNLIEEMINGVYKNELEQMYGNNSVFSIRDIGYSPSSKTLYIDSKIILGDVINESVMDSEMITLLLSDGIKFFYNDVNLSLTVSFDV